MTDAPADRPADDEPTASEGEETTAFAGGPSTDRDIDAETDDAAASAATDDGGTARSSDSTGPGRWRSREVEVPMRVYKTVTVFATLIAVVSVLAGFVLVDIATDRASLPLSDVDAVVALSGIGAMVFGAAIYAFSTRFRATGMGKPNTDGGQSDDDE